MKLNKISPLVSVITPSFNQGEYIEETILSVVNQTYPNIEYIVVDGGSSDGTLDVLKRYPALFAKVVSEKDAGQADAINKGIRAATGDFVTWINSDDLLHPRAIENAIATFIANPDVDFVYGDVNLIDENSTHLRLLKGRQVSKPNVFYILDLPIPQQGSIWRRKVTSSTGLLCDKWQYVLDRDFFLKICINHKVIYVNQTLGYFRQHNQSKSVKMKEGWIPELISMYEALVTNSNWPFKQFSEISKKVRSSAYINAAYLSLGAGKIGKAFKYIGLACFIYPMIIFNRHIYSKPISKIKYLIYRKISNDN